MRRTTMALTAIMLSFGAVQTVQAAPQMLGVVATAAPLKLHCEGDVCRTQISTICLQAHRDTPKRHQAYKAHNPGAFSVLAKNTENEVVSMALPQSSFMSIRGYSAVEVAVDISSLHGAGLVPMSLTVAHDGLLVPVAIANDPDPIETDEITHAMASLKPAADEVFKQHGPEYEAVRLVNRLLNETPMKGRMAKADRDQLWDDTFGESARESVGAGAHRAADIAGYCQYRTKQGRFFSVRRCLEQRLDGMLMNINTEYWRAVQPGS
jgi:hypothetical protein